MSLDIKDQMILEEQERREQMHLAVDDVESQVEGQTWCVEDRYLTYRNYNILIYKLR